MLIFSRIKQICISHKYLLAIIVYFLLLRLINLTLLPVFNDEAIYLDWGWRETNTPNYLFYSLYDAKQLHLMWVFGIAEHIFVDPLVAGRLVSVGFGLGSLTGLYVLGKTVWNRSVGLLAALLYAISPLFVFYDRQALMESAIAEIGIWACFFLLKLTSKPTIQNSIFLGITLGIGFFIKSTGLVFMGTSLLIFALLLWIEKQKMQIFAVLCITYLTALLVLLPLILQLQFWQTLSSDARFSLTLRDILQFLYKHGEVISSHFFKQLFFCDSPCVYCSNRWNLADFTEKYNT